MALKTWQGRALAVPQITTLTVGGAPVIGDTVWVEINRRRATYTVLASPTTAIMAAGLYAAIQALITAGVAPEFAEITWSDPSATAASAFTGTSATAGQPFTLTVGVTGTVTLGQAATQAATGPNHFDNAANFDTNSVLVAADDLLVPAGSPDILYGLTQATALALGTVKILGGNVGLPDRTGSNASDPTSYVEYRNKSLEFASATAVHIGDGTNAPDFCRVKITGAVSTPIRVNSGAGTSSENAILLSAAAGTAHALTVVGNSVGVALMSGEVMEISTLRVGTEGPEGSFGAGDSDPTMTLSSGVTIAAGRMYGGTVRSDATFTALTIIDGEWNQDGGTPGTVSATDSAGAYRYTGNASHGVITGRGAGVVFDFSGDSRGFTLASGSSITEGAAIYNPQRINCTPTFTIDKESVAASQLGNSINLVLTAA